jgi:hypothetical protein
LSVFSPFVDVSQIMSLPIDDYQRQLQWRIKQVEIGKATDAYACFRALYPPHARRRAHPRTPDPYDARSSKRQFEGRVKAWKRQIHELTYNQPESMGRNPSNYGIKCNLFVTKRELEVRPHLKTLDGAEIICAEST